MNDIEELFEKEMSNPHYREIISKGKNIDRNYVLEFTNSPPCGLKASLYTTKEDKMYRAVREYSDFAQFDLNSDSPFVKVVYKLVEDIETYLIPKND